jgi:hypothetical protein
MSLAVQFLDGPCRLKCDAPHIRARLTTSTYAFDPDGLQGQKKRQPSERPTTPSLPCWPFCWPMDGGI